MFMPNWATDEPAAISDNSLSRRKEEASAKGEEEGDREYCSGEMRSGGGAYKKNRRRKRARVFGCEERISRRKRG